MEFPNLVWALDEKRLSQYEIAARIGMSPFRFSRCVRGRAVFAPRDRERIAESLDYPERWLFAHPTPPAKRPVETAVSAGVSA